MNTVGLIEVNIDYSQTREIKHQIHKRDKKVSCKVVAASSISIQLSSFSFLISFIMYLHPALFPLYIGQCSKLTLSLTVCTFKKNQFVLSLPISPNP